MVTFQPVRLKQAGAFLVDGWAVERLEPDGTPITVSQFHATKFEAEAEANRLNLEAARRTMG
jgi:hypothetical protein